MVDRPVFTAYLCSRRSGRVVLNNSEALSQSHAKRTAALKHTCCCTLIECFFLMASQSTCFMRSEGAAASLNRYPPCCCKARALCCTASSVMCTLLKAQPRTSPRLRRGACHCGACRSGASLACSPARSGAASGPPVLLAAVNLIRACGRSSKFKFKGLSLAGPPQPAPPLAWAWQWHAERQLCGLHCHAYDPLPGLHVVQLLARLSRFAAAARPRAGLPQLVQLGAVRIHGCTSPGRQRLHWLPLVWLLRRQRPPLALAERQQGQRHVCHLRAAVRPAPAELARLLAACQPQQRQVRQRGRSLELLPLEHCFRHWEQPRWQSPLSCCLFCRRGLQGCQRAA